MFSTLKSCVQIFIILLFTGTPGQPKFDSSTVDKESNSPILVWKVESYSPIIEYELLYKEETVIVIDL